MAERRFQTDSSLLNRMLLLSIIFQWNGFWQHIKELFILLRECKTLYNTLCSFRLQVSLSLVLFLIFLWADKLSFPEDTSAESKWDIKSSPQQNENETDSVSHISNAMYPSLMIFFSPNQICLEVNVMQTEILELGVEGWQLHLMVAESSKITLNHFSVWQKPWYSTSLSEYLITTNEAWTEPCYCSPICLSHWIRVILLLWKICQPPSL